VGKVWDQKAWEISGIAASHRNPGYFYVHEDSGAQAVISVLNSDGKTMGRLWFRDITARDWEDIAVANCGWNAAADCIWVADTGDNGSWRSDTHLLRVVEPDLNNLLESGEWFDKFLTPEQIYFRYPNFKQDSEALIVDSTGTPAVFSKNGEGRARLYTFQSVKYGSATLKYEGDIWLGMVTGADLSPDDQTLILRTQYSAWQLDLRGRTVAELLTAPRLELPVIREPQGESIAYDPYQQKIWHISEGGGQPLYNLECLSS